MSDNWDFYSVQVDGQPASIFVDLGLAEEAPVERLSAMAYLRLQLREPGPQGLSSQAEFDALVRVEDALTQLEAASGAVYVGRCTWAGQRDFYFYAPDAEPWSELVESFMRAFRDYRYECGARADPRWSVYFEFLHPGDEGLQRMGNRRVCEALARNGDALLAARAIRHWIYFADGAARAACSAAAIALGCQVVEHSEPSDTDSRLGLCLSNFGVPSFADIDELTLPLWRLAREHGAQYDGWECEVVG